MNSVRHMAVCPHMVLGEVFEDTEPPSEVDGIPVLETDRGLYLGPLDVVNDQIIWTYANIMLKSEVMKTLRGLGWNTGEADQIRDSIRKLVLAD